MLGIPKYKPQYFSDANSFLIVNKGFLLQALDKKISNYYVQWDTKLNEWNNDGPIILVINSIQYEFTAYELAEYSFTRNKIDLTKKLNWYDAGDEIPLVWKKDTFDHLNIIIGKTIKAIFLIEYNFFIHNAEDGEPIKDEDYDLVGIEFEFHDTNECLSLTNDLDCNKMNLSRTEENTIYRRIKVKH